MKFAEHLKEEDKNKLNKLKPKKLSDRDLRELMGINRDTYKRNRGAIRRK
jgi:hypothetical protein